MFAYVPFVFLVLSTILLMHFLGARQKRVHALFSNFQDKLSIMRIRRVMAGAVIWCMMVTFPSATAKIFYSTLVTSNSGQLVIRLTDIWIFTLHSLNFFFLFGSNKFFRNEVKKAIKMQH